jgi:SAM-dependent methyltransferase
VETVKLILQKRNNRLGVNLMENLVKKPNLYDLLYQDVTEDISMYLKLLDGNQNILEFGAGTGRVTIPLAEADHNIDAVDIEENMLDTLSKRISKDSTLSSRINPILGNMCGYVSGKLYDAIIIPLTSFNYLLTEEEQISCLKSVFNNLKEGGFAIIELISNNTYDDVMLDDKFRFVKKISLSENQYYEYYRDTYLDMENRKITQKRLFKLFESDQLVAEENYIWENRFVTVDDFIRLAIIAGLEVEEVYGDCNLEKYNKNSDDVFVKVRRI